MTGMTMRDFRTLARAGCAALAVVMGCGGGAGARVVAPTPPVEPAGGDEAEPVEPSYFVEASAEADSADEAYEAAMGELEVKLYGSAEWAAALDVPVHDRAADPYREQAAEGKVTVTVGLDQPRAAEILTAVASAPWEPEVPAPLADQLLPAARRFFARFVCERRAVLLGEPCDLTTVDGAADADAITAQVRTVAGTVRLRAFYDGGVPLAADFSPLRPVTVIAEHDVGGRWTPLADLPVVPVWLDEAASGQTQGVSDRDGVVRLVAADGALFGDGAVIARVGVDRSALLGPMVQLWPEGISVDVQGRRTGTKRFVLVVTERVQGKPASEQVFAAELSAALVAEGGDAGQLASVVASDLAATTAGKLPLKLTALADTWQGSVDVVLIAEVDSDYASQLGPHRVRYDARGRVRVYDVWTGTLIGDLDAAVTVSGVGETRADRAARAALAGRLADKLRELGR